MTVTQIEYAAGRLQILYSDQKQALNAQLPTDKPDSPMKAFARYANKRPHRIEIANYYSFNDDDNDGVTQYAAFKVVFKNLPKPKAKVSLKVLAVRAQLKALDKKYQEIKDQLYLGDAERALALIEDFRKV